MRITIPNQITLLRLIIALVFFVLLTTLDLGAFGNRPQILSVAFWIFLAAALGDILDGFLARAMHQETSFGRIVDPVVDKVMVCGAFIFFASHQFFDPQRHVNITGVAPWMAVVVLVRELLVSAIRSYSESRGRDYSASWVGKVKMFVQCTTVCVILGQLAWFPSLEWLRTGCIWATVIVTTLSILSYVQRARSFLLSGVALGGPKQSGAKSRDQGGLPRVSRSAKPGSAPI